MSKIPTFDGTTYRATRVQTRPLDPGAGGAYSMSAVTGVMAAGLAANAEVVQFFSSSTTLSAVIEEIRFDGGGDASHSGPECVGVKDLRSGRECRGRGNSYFAERGSRDGEGARLDGREPIDPLRKGGGHVAATIGVSMPQAMIYQSFGNTYPVVIAPSEGFVITATVPATGVWTAGFTIRWTEVLAY